MQMINVFAVWVLICFSASALANPQAGTNAAGHSKLHTIKWELLPLIKKAQDVLSKGPVAGCGLLRKPCRTPSQFAQANFILAVKAPNSKLIKSVVVLYDGQTTEGYTVARGTSNGVGTRFAVDGHIVLALRRAVRTADGKYAEVVYTPYSPEIDTIELRKQGKQYLVNLLNDAKNDLRNKGVLSNAFRGENVADVMPTWVTLRLIIVEHIDPERLSTESAEQLVNEVFVIAAANTANAYRYASSTARARGLLQLTASSYHLVRSNYVDAELDRNFVRGAGDHKNAVEAAMLLFDSDMTSLSQEKRNMFRKDKIKLMQYLGAAYNTGAARAQRSMLADGSIVHEQLPSETQWYLQKLKEVHDILPMI